jgi:hypothetical protein
MTTPIEPTWRVELGLGDYSAAVLADSPVGYWRLGEFSGTNADDSSGNGRDGSITGSPTLGIRGALPENDAAVQFGSAGSSVNIASVPVPAHPTFECWFKANGFGLNFMRLWSSGSVVSFPVDIGFEVTTGRLIFFLNYTTTTPGWINSGWLATIGVWYHLALTFDGTWVRIYINGSQVYSSNAWSGLTLINAGSSGGHRGIGNVSSDDGSTGAEFDGVIDEVALYNSALSAARILAHYTAGSWTNVRTDVVAAESIRWKRGQAIGAAPTDRTPRPGTFEFSLRNDARNSGSLQGYYSPGHANCRSGFTRGIPVRLVATYAATDYTLWTGRLRTIDPDPGRYRSQRTHCLAQDVIADMAETTVREITAQIDKTEVQLLTAILEGLPTSGRPSAVDFDTALDTYAYALYNAGSGSAPLGLLNDVVVSALGSLYLAGDGTLVYENRHSRVLRASDYTLDGDTAGDALIVPSTLEGRYNHIRATIHQLTATPATTLFASAGAIAVSGGATVTVWGTYADPNNRDRLIGASAFTNPLVSGTDFVGNSQADGLGTSRTSSLAVTVTPFATTAKFDITNSYTDTVYVTTLQLRGTGIFDNAPQVFESVTEEDYGDRTLEIDLKYQDDANIGQDMADYLVAQLSDPSQVNAVAIKANKSTTLMTQALARDLGDVISVSETVTALSGVEASIAGIDGEVTGGVWLRMTWNLLPQTTIGALVLDDAVFGVLDSPEAVLGYA